MRALPGRQFPSVAALEDGGFVVSWSKGGSIYARLFDASGGAAHPEFVVTTVGASTGLPLSTVTALPDGGFVVSWNSRRGRE